MHISDVTVALGIGEDDAGSDGIVAFAENIRGDLELFVDDRVDRQVATFDLRMDVVDRNAPKSAQWWASGRIDSAYNCGETLAARGMPGSVTRRLRLRWFWRQ